MSEKINQAIKHITGQAMADGREIAIFIEETITERCTTEDIAGKVLNEDKTLKELLNQINEKARKTAVENVGCLSKEEVKKMAFKYYDIDETETEMIDVMDLL